MQLRHKSKPCLTLALWPILQYANFKYLGPEFRVIGTKCSELVFDVIMSYILNNHITIETMVKDGKDWWNGESDHRVDSEKIVKNEMSVKTGINSEIKSETNSEITEKPVNSNEIPKNE